jgi:hypothetical protein
MEIANMLKYGYPVGAQYNSISKHHEGGCILLVKELMKKFLPFSWVTVKSLLTPKKVKTVAEPRKKIAAAYVLAYLDKHNGSLARDVMDKAFPRTFVISIINVKRILERLVAEDELYRTGSQNRYRYYIERLEENT